MISKSRTGYQENIRSAERYWHLNTEAIIGGSKQAQAGASGGFRFAVWPYANMTIHTRTHTLSKSVTTKRIQRTRAHKVQDQSLFRCSSKFMTHLQKFLAWHGRTRDTNMGAVGLKCTQCEQETWRRMEWVGNFDRKKEAS